MQLHAMMDGIASSDAFVALVTEAWLNAPHCQAQLERAVALHKPILLLVEDGVTLPPHIRRAATAVRRFSRSNIDDAVRAIKEFAAGS